MATGEGGGSGHDDGGGGGGTSASIRRFKLWAPDAGFGIDSSPSPSPPPSPHLQARSKAWSSEGMTSVEEQMSHYVADGGLESELWELYIQFDGVKFVHHSMRRSDIRYLNLLSLMEKEGYGMSDCMYYVKDEGEGLNGLELVDSNAKVVDMVKKYEATKQLVLTVIRDKRQQAIVLSPVKVKKTVNETSNAGRSHINILSDGEENIANIQTQGSANEGPSHFNTQVGDNEYADQEEEEEEVESSDDSGAWYDIGEYDSVLGEEKRQKDVEELKKTIAEMRRRRLDPLHHCEGDTDVEDIFVIEEEEIDDEQEQIPVEEPMQKKPKKQGPTLRSHSQIEEPDVADWMPSDDEEDGGLIKSEDDDHFQPLAFILPKKRKSRAKKAKPRVWYDESRENPEQQFKLNLCFKDVYQFRQALCRLHIVQVRNFVYHRNCKDRIIVCCKEKEKYSCPFYMMASQVGKEETFCIKKMHLQHICPTEPSSSRVNSKWLSTAYVDEFKSDPNTGITSIVDKAKKDFGVEVPKRMAYRAKSKARDIVLGDHKKQYHRIRDYLQTVVDKNPGSRCIVTTVTGPTEDQMEAMKRGEEVCISNSPRFHGLFFCVNAAKLGFLEGCRPFIGLDGCFIKLATGAQILAATGRDGNNNIYPIAFGVVAKEDTANWLWFLEQLKYALGGEEGKFGHYTIMSDRQKGLINAIHKVFPNCPVRYCLRHIYANFQTAGFRGDDLKKCMDNAAYSYTKDGFDDAMEELKKQCEPAWNWLTKIPVHTWARWAMDSNCKTDLVVNNLSEVFNRYILDVRNKPIVTMLVGIYDKLMDRFNGKREGGQTARWEITPFYAEKLELMKKYERGCTPRRSDLGLWQVKSGANTHEVNLDKATCSCRKWDMSGLPCNHAVSAIYKARLHPEDFVSEFYKKPMYLKSYAPVFYPVPGQHGWTRTPYEDIMPPGFKEHRRGRKA
ncbi:unnamed protein product [Alopecurus aequalis]